MKNFPINDRKFFFENTGDVSTTTPIGFLPNHLELALLNDHQNGYFSVRELSGGKPGDKVNREMYVKCSNYQHHDVCNWMIPATTADAQDFCEACRLNKIIPDLSNPRSKFLWGKMETAKRRLIYTLLRLGLSIEGREEDPEHGLAFQFLEDEPSASKPGETFHVMTGHHAGIVTLNLEEADDAVREANRTAMGEGYRTLLGHFRHEVGHHYWDLLIRDTLRHEKFRDLFGDETADYQQCLQYYYNNGAPENWSEYYVSEYASSHPWEDWAECWGHYLYMIDALEFAEDSGVLMTEKANGKVPRIFESRRGPLVADLPTLLNQWLHVSTMLNSLNRIAGIIDPNPFILSPLATKKMQFVHDVITGKI